MTESKVEAGAPSKMEAAQTVRVRIGVGVDANGAWCAYGANGMDDSEALALAVESLKPGEARYVIEAELVIPSDAPVFVAVTDAQVTAVPTPPEDA